MIDAFDSAFSNPQPQPRRQYEPAPPGVCSVEIIKAEHKAVPWRATDANPTGDCIALRLSASSAYGFLFADLPADKPWLRKVVGAAVGIAPDTLTPEQLVGREARVEITHITTRNGEIRAVVKKWLPAAKEPQPAASNTATLTDAVAAWVRDDRQEQRQPRQAAPQQVKRSRSAPPQIGVEDDIPF